MPEGFGAGWLRTTLHNSTQYTWRVWCISGGAGLRGYTCHHMHCHPRYLWVKKKIVGINTMTKDAITLESKYKK